VCSHLLESERLDDNEERPHDAIGRMTPADREAKAAEVSGKVLSLDARAYESAVEPPGRAYGAGRLPMLRRKPLPKAAAAPGPSGLRDLDPISRLLSVTSARRRHRAAHAP
jgi:hypothetical protein